MSGNFNPYHEWLSVDERYVNPNFYQLLGIKSSETDKTRIASLAKAALKKLESIPPGDHEPARIRLVAQVNQALNCLSDDEQRRGYDTRLKAAKKAELVEAGKLKAKKKLNGAAKQVDDALPPQIQQDAWPPGTHESTDAPASQIPQANPEIGNPAIPQVSAPVPAAIESHSDLPNPAIPVVSAPEAPVVSAPESDLPEPVLPPTVGLPEPALPQPITTNPVANPAAAELVPMQVVPEAAAAHQPAVAQPVMPQPVPVAPAQPGYAQSAIAQPIGQVPQAPAEIAAQPVASLPSSIPAASQVPGAPQATAAPVVGGATDAAERYRTLRRKARIKSAIGGVLVLGVLRIGGYFGYKYRDAWMPSGEVAAVTSDSGTDDSENSSEVSTSDNNSNDDETKASSTEDANKVNPGDSALVPLDEPDDAKMNDSPDSESKENDAAPEMSEDDVPMEEPEDTEPSEAEMKDTSSGPDTDELKIAAKLGDVLVSARQALFDRKLDDANKLIAEAETLAADTQHQDIVLRLKGIADQIDTFWKTVVSECGKLKSTDEIEMSASVIVVVEASEEKIIYRASGERGEFVPLELPLGLAMKIAERAWSEQTAETRLTRGSVYAIDSLERPANGEKAREIFREAELVGADPQPFVGFLDDDYDLVSSLIVQEDVPEEDVVKKATAKLAQDYREFAASVDSKSELAQKLLDDMAGLPDAASRYAALDLAKGQARLANDIPLMIKVVDTQAKWFNTDSDEVKASTLEAALKSGLSRDAAKELTRTAFELADEAEFANNLKLAARYARISLSAAQKSRNSDLKKKAAELNMQMKAKVKNAG